MAFASANPPKVARRSESAVATRRYTENLGGYRPSSKSRSQLHQMRAIFNRSVIEQFPADTSSPKKGLSRVSWILNQPIIVKLTQTVLTRRCSHVR